MREEKCAEVDEEAQRERTTLVTADENG